jgi:hypothetical protein
MDALISYAVKDSPFVWSSLGSMDTGTGVPSHTPASYVAACLTSIYTTFHTEDNYEPPDLNQIVLPSELTELEVGHP